MPLPRENHEIIDPFGVVSKVQFPKHGGLVSCFLEQLGKGYLARIKRSSIINLPINMIMFSGQDRSP